VMLFRGVLKKIGWHVYQRCFSETRRVPLKAKPSSERNEYTNLVTGL
jgi:hypothetical protein